MLLVVVSQKFTSIFILNLNFQKLLNILFENISLNCCTYNTYYWRFAKMLPHVLDFFIEGSQLVIKYQSFVYDARRRCAYGSFNVRRPIGTASANSVESDLGCSPRIYFDNVALTIHYVTLTSHKQHQHNNMCDCSKQTVIN